MQAFSISQGNTALYYSFTVDFWNSLWSLLHVQSNAAALLKTLLKLKCFNKNYVIRIATSHWKIFCLFHLFIIIIIIQVNDVSKWRYKYV